MKILSLLSLLMLTACGLGAGLAQLASDSGSAQADLWVDNVSPRWGPTAGGTVVTVTGGGFDGDVSVLFGSASVDVTVVSTDELVVSSPATSLELAVDLTIRSDKGETVVGDGFVYSDSGPPDTGTGTTAGDGGAGDGGAGDGGGGDAGATGPEAGKVSGLVEFYYEVTACASCFGLSSQLAVGAIASFHTPIYGSWVDWLPPQGSCSTTAAATQLTSDSTDVGEWVYLEAGSTSQGLRRTTSGGRTVYEVTGLGSDDYVRNTSWDLSVSDGGSWGPFSLTDVVVTTEGFDDVQPLEILNDGAQAFGAQISPNNATFSWSPSGLADDFVVILDVYNSTGANYLGSVLCNSADSGSMTVPASGLSAYPSGALLAITMYRYQVEEAINSADGSTIQGISSFGLIGTGTLR